MAHFRQRLEELRVLRVLQQPELLDDVVRRHVGHALRRISVHRPEVGALLQRHDDLPVDGDEDRERNDEHDERVDHGLLDEDVRPLVERSERDHAKAQALDCGWH